MTILKRNSIILIKKKLSCKNFLANDSTEVRSVSVPYSTYMCV